MKNQEQTNEGSRRDPESIRKEYKELKKASISYLRTEWSRSFRVGDPKGTDKTGLISDILRARHGNKHVDAAFESEVTEIRRSSVSGTMSGSVYSLEDRKYELKKDVKGARIGDFINVTLPKGTIIYNLPGGLFADHFSLKSRYTTPYGNGPKWLSQSWGQGVSIRQMPETLSSIEKNSKVLESVVTEKREDVGKYNTVKKVIAELGRRPSEQDLATFINNNYYDVTEVERGDDDPTANDKIADLVGFYKFDIEDWETAWADAQNESVVTEAISVEVGDYIKTEHGYYYRRINGEVGGQEAFVEISKGKEKKRKTSIHNSASFELVDAEEALSESVVTEAKLARGLKPLLTIGSTITKNAGEDALLDLSDKFDSIDDEYAGTIASWLDMAIELMQDRYAGDATKKLKQFNKACKDVLNGKEVGSAFESVVNEAENYITDKFKVGDKIKTGFGEWEVIETDYAPGKSFIAPFIFKGKDIKRVDIPNPPKTNKNAVGYKVTDGTKYPIIGFLYQYKDITKLTTIGVDESVVTEKVEKIACLECDEVNTKKAWEKNNGFCPSCKVSSKGVAESIITEAKAYKLKASEFGSNTFSAAYNVKGETTWRVHSTYAIDQVSGENDASERDVVFFEAMPINNDIYIKIGGINNLKRTGSTVGDNFGTTIEEWKKDPKGIAKEASEFLTDATHLKWINKKARSQGQTIKWALKDDYSSVIEDLVNKSLGLSESVVTEAKYKAGDKWEWKTRSNSKVIKIIRVESNGDIIAKEDGKSQHFIVRDADKYLTKIINEAAKIETERYVRSHGKKPKGYGGWMFSYNRDGSDEWQIPNGMSWPDAQKWAKKKAKEDGEDYVYVMESVVTGFTEAKMTKDKLENLIYSLENEKDSWHPSSDSKKKSMLDKLKKDLSKFESVVTEEVVYNSSNTKPEAAKKATKEFGNLLPKANKGVKPYVFAVVKTKARNYRLAIKSGSYIAHEFMSGLKEDGILTADIVKKAVANVIKMNPEEFNESAVTEAKGLPSHARNLSIKLKTHWLPDTDNKDIYFLADTNKGQTITIDLSVRTGEYKVIDKKDNVIYQGGDPYAAAKLIESVVTEAKRLSFKDAGITDTMDLSKAMDALRDSKIDWNQKGQAFVFVSSKEHAAAIKALGLDESVVTEAKNTIGLAFKEEQDYLDFKEFVAEQPRGAIRKNIGFDSKTKSWNVEMDVKVLDSIYGEGTSGNKESGWYGGLPDDFESVIIESNVDEANKGKVHRAAKKGSYPAVIVVVQDGKVIHQEPVSTPEVAPATFNVMQEKYPKALLHLEDNTGKRLFSESVVNEASKDRMVKQIERALKDGMSIFKLPMATQKYYIKNKSDFEAVTEGKYTNKFLDVKDLHFEIDPKNAEEMKIELGKRQGELNKRKQIEGGEYSLRRFRKEIKYDTTGKDLGVFRPGSYMAATSTLGDGPHKKAVKAVKWNQRKYDQWLEDVASNDGWKNASDMAQNAKNEPGLIDWVKKNNRGEDALQRIQWDIEAFAESVVTESKPFIITDFNAFILESKIYNK